MNEESGAKSQYHPYKQTQKLDSTTNVIPIYSPCVEKEYVNRYEVHINIDIYCRYRCVCVYTHTHTQTPDMYVHMYKHIYIQNIKYIQYTLCAVVHYMHTHTHTQNADMYVHMYKHIYIQNIKYIQYI